MKMVHRQDNLLRENLGSQLHAEYKIKNRFPILNGIIKWRTTKCKVTITRLVTEQCRCFIEEIVF